MFLPATAAVLFSAAQATIATADTVASVYSNNTTHVVSSLTGTVTSILNLTSTANAFVLMDSSGSIFAYNVTKANYTANVGDNITVTNVTDSPYQNAPELTNTGLTSSSFVTNSTGNAVSPNVLTVPQFNGAGNGASSGVTNPPYAEALVEVDNVSLPAGTGTLNSATNTSYTLTDQSGNTTVLFTYKSYTATLAATQNADTANTASGGTLFQGLIDIVGYADVFNGQAELYPLSITAAPAVPEPASVG